jgi:hypothetical protein
MATIHLHPGVGTMRPLKIVALIAVLSLAAGRLPAQQANQAPTRNVPDSLVSKAKVNEDSARAIALKRVPGTVETVHLLNKSGKLEWMFGIKANGKNGMEKVTVSATSGHVLAVSAAGSTKKSSTTHHSS